MATKVQGWAVAGMIALAAGCSAVKLAPPAPAGPDPEFRVNRIERLRFNDPPEPGLFRVEFGPKASADVRFRAKEMDARDEKDIINAELGIMEEFADRELRARNLCAHGVRMISMVDGVTEATPLAGFFRCKGRSLLE